MSSGGLLPPPLGIFLNEPLPGYGQEPLFAELMVSWYRASANPVSLVSKHLLLCVQKESTRLGVHLGKSLRGGKSKSEDVLGGHAHSEQYSILKG